MSKLRFKVGPHGSRDSAGNPYVTLTQAGLKEEAAAPQSVEHESDAWAAYWAVLSDFLATHKAKTVEWRLHPTLEHWNDRVWIRSRLSVVEGFGR